MLPKGNCIGSTSRVSATSKNKIVKSEWNLNLCCSSGPINVLNWGNQNTVSSQKSDCETLNWILFKNSDYILFHDLPFPGSIVDLVVVLAVGVMVLPGVATVLAVAADIELSAVFLVAVLIVVVVAVTLQT